MSGSIVSPFAPANALFDLGDIYKTVDAHRSSEAYRNALLQNAETNAGELQLKRDTAARIQEAVRAAAGGGETTGTTTGAAPPGDGFETQLVGSELGGNSGVVNPQGYSGKYQFGAARLADLGLYKPAEGEDLSKNEWKGTFNIGPYAVTTHADFLKNPAAQHAAFQRHVANIDEAIAATPGADKMDPNGLRAVAHLGGVEGMKRFIATGGVYNPADANRTRLSDYYQRFAQGGAPALAAQFGSPDAQRQQTAQAPPGSSSLPTPPIPPTEVPPPPGGVAGRTGGVDVAGPGAPTAPTPPAPAAPVALPSPFVSMVPGGTPTNQLAPQRPVVPPATAPVTPPATAPTTTEPPTTVAPVKPDYSGLTPPPKTLTSGPDAGLTAEQARRFKVQGATVSSAEQFSQWQQQKEAAKNANQAEQRQYQSDVRQRENDARTATQQAANLDLSKQAGQRDAERLAIQQDKERRANEAPQGQTQEERDGWTLKNKPHDSPEYAEAWTRQKWQVAPGSGNIIERDMSQYAPPTRSIQRPNYVPAPTAASLDKVRQMSADATVITGAIDRYVDIFEQGGRGGSWDAFFANPTDPATQQLLGAFGAMKTVLRSPTYMNTGVLQPGEDVMLKEELVSPQTLRGLFSTPAAMAARLGEIKIAVLNRADAEQRSIGQDGVIVRSKADFDKIPEGGKFYNEDGKRYVKDTKKERSGG